MKSLRLLIALLVILPVPALIHAQGWEHIYPANEHEGLTDILHWNGDTAYACGTNWTLLRTVDGGATWEYLLHAQRNLDFFAMAAGGGQIFLRAVKKSWQMYGVSNDSTFYIFSYNPVDGSMEDLTFTGDWDITSVRDFPPLYATDRFVYVPQVWFTFRLYTYDTILDSWSVYENPDTRATFLPISDNLILYLSREYGGSAPTLRHVSTDAGATWSMDTVQTLSYVSENIPITTVATPAGIRCIAADEFIIFYSDDTCRTWTETAEIPWKSSGTPRIVDIEAVSETIWYVMGYEGDVYATHDGGATWAQLKPPLPVLYRSTRAYCNIASIGALNMVITTPQGGFIRSVNGGITWDSNQEGAFAAAARIHFFDTRHGILLGWDADNIPAMFATSDGGASWDRTGNFETSNIHNLTEVPSFDEFYSYTLQDSIAVFTLYKTTDQGRTWEYVHESVVGAGVEKCYAFRNVYIITTSPQSSQAGMWVSKDRGRTWDFTDVPTPVFTPEDVQGTYDEHGNLVCYLTLGEPRKMALFKSSDSCQTWAGVLSSGFGVEKIFNELDVVSADTVFVRDEYYVKYTYDGGVSWSTMVPPNRTGISISDYQYYPPSIRSLDGAVRVSETRDMWNSHSVQIARSKLTTNAVWYFLDSANGWLASGQDLYRTSTGGVNWVRTAPDMPEGFDFSSVYPNPVTAGSSVSIHLYNAGVGAQHAAPTSLRVSVYDLLGREVAVLYEGRTNELNHALTWNTAALNPGMYYIVASAGTHRAQRAVVVMQ